MNNQAEQHKKLQRTTEPVSSLMFHFPEIQPAVHTTKHLTELLGAKLNNQSRKWNARVLWYEPGQIVAYDLIAKKKLFSLVSRVYPDIMQLKDGAIAVSIDETLTLYDTNGNLIHSTESKLDLSKAIELQNGNILFISDNLGSPKTALLNRIDNTINLFPHLEYEFVVQLSDRRIVFFGSHEDVSVYEETLEEELQSFQQTWTVSHVTLYQDNLILCSEDDDFFTVDIETEEVEEFLLPETENATIRMLQNGVLVLRKPDALLFVNDQEEDEETIKIDATVEKVTEVMPGVVVYFNSSTKKVNTFDTNTGTQKEYSIDMPNESSYVLTFLRNFHE
jgi:hypothetical protein